MDFTITITNVPKDILDRMFTGMRDAKLDVQSEVLKTPDDYNIKLNFDDCLISLKSFDLMSNVFISSMALYTYNQDGKLTPKL